MVKVLLLFLTMRSVFMVDRASEWCVVWEGEIFKRQDILTNSILQTLTELNRLQVCYCHRF